MEPAAARRALVWLAVGFWLAVAWSAVHPFDPFDYLLEIVTPVGGCAVLVAWRRASNFSTLSDALMLCEVPGTLNKDMLMGGLGAVAGLLALTRAHGQALSVYFPPSTETA
jgi:hypothetical protein